LRTDPVYIKFVRCNLRSCTLSLCLLLLTSQQYLSHHVGMFMIMFVPNFTCLSPPSHYVLS